jgi:hypothetical protein
MYENLPNQIVFRRGSYRIMDRAELQKKLDSDSFGYDDASDELYEVEHVSMKSLNSEHPLPSGMFAGYDVIRRMSDGREDVRGVMQARAAGGRRYFSDATESETQARLLKWSARIFREMRKFVAEQADAEVRFAAYQAEQRAMRLPSFSFRGQS